MNRSTHSTSSIAIVGDVHGHLQLALGMLARWQQELGIRWEAILLCGDVGTFTDDSQVDSATHSHARRNPSELEFLYQWSQSPQPAWIDAIFQPTEDGGLGIECPVIMVHGNHEGFDHLESLIPSQAPEKRKAPEEIIAINELPTVDTGNRIFYLPSGWITETKSGTTIGGIGGIERGQRGSNYHSLAYVDEDAILQVLEYSQVHGQLDILISHQGPSGVQGTHGSDSLQILLEEKDCQVLVSWTFHADFRTDNYFWNRREFGNHYGRSVG